MRLTVEKNMFKTRIWAAVLCACATTASFAAKQTFEEVQAAALRGDYQAQRNLAFGYSSWSYDGQEKNPILACAWRIVILLSERADETDQMNYEVYCGQLSKQHYYLATVKADKLISSIDNKQ
tara:strand:+ start:411 stop:779 length:369 start_codon:yes stop_codon:yes gene_type:complete